MAVFLLGYDVESQDPAITGQFLDSAERIHTRLKAPTTLFLVGQTAQLNVVRLKELEKNPYFEFQSHTYSHKLLKTVCSFDGKETKVHLGATLEEIDEELKLANEILLEQFGTTCKGLTGPYNYYRGLADRPDILALVRKHGIRYLRTYGRNEHDWQPVSLHLQPFWYEAQGFPEILECNINGWQDCIKRDYYGWSEKNAYVADVCKDLDYAQSNDLVFSYVQHDWSSIKEDPEMTATEAILEYAQNIGMQIMSYSQFYDLMESRRNQMYAASS